MIYSALMRRIAAQIFFDDREREHAQGHRFDCLPDVALPLRPKVKMTLVGLGDESADNPERC